MFTLLASLASAYDHDHAALAVVLDGATDARGVDYARIASRRASLDAWLADAREAPVATFSRDEAMAFWIDAYNAVTLAVVLDAGAIASIRDLDGGKVWTARRFRVGGQDLTLDAIENTVLRPMGDPRVHAALVCAARSCPPLPSTPARAAGLDGWLEAAARGWVATTAWKDGPTVSLSPIFDWYGADFRVDADVPGVDGHQEAALLFVAARVDPVVAARLRAGPKVAWATYDWALNTRH